MQSLDTTIVNTALPSIAVSLHTTPLALKPIVIAYALTMALITPASGWLAERFGIREVFLAAISIFVAGSLFCALAHTPHELVLARVVQGVGGSMLLPMGRLSIMKSATGDRYVAALASISVAGQVGPILGPTLGGWLVQTLSWHWIFLINLPIGLVGVYAVWRFMEDLPREAQSGFDTLGFVLVALAMLFYTLSLDIHPQSMMKATLVFIGLIVGGTLCVTGYIGHARRRADPLFRLALFEDANFSIGLLGNLANRIGTSAIPFLMPLLLQVALGYSPLHAGMMMLPAAISGAVFKKLIPPALRRLGYNHCIQFNTVIAGITIIALGMINADTPLWFIIVVLTLFGGSNAILTAVMNSVTLKGLPRQDAGSGNSLFSMMQMLALGLGAAIGGGVAQLLEPHLSEVLYAYRFSFLCVGLITLASLPIFRKMDWRAVSSANTKPVKTAS